MRRVAAAFTVAAIVALSTDARHPFLVALVVYVPLWGLLGAIRWAKVTHPERRRHRIWQGSLTHVGTLKGGA